MWPLRAAVRLPVLLLWSIWVALTALGDGRFSSEVRIRRCGERIGRWSRVCLRILGVEVDVVGRRPVGTTLLVCNHLSYLDVIVIASVVEAAFVAKDEVLHWPLVGWMCKAGGTLWVDRSSRRAQPAVVAAITERLHQGGSVALFPEGTSSDGSGVLTFRSTLLEAASANDLPVVAAAIGYRTGPGEPPARMAVCWWGRMTLLPHLTRLAGMAKIEARLAFDDQPVHSLDRKDLARRLEQRVLAHFQPVSTESS